MLSDLIGEVPEVQPVSNISTAADLLKQGAGEFTILPSLPEEVKLLSMYIQYFTEYGVYYSYIVQPLTELSFCTEKNPVKRLS